MPGRMTYALSQPRGAAAAIGSCWAARAKRGVKGRGYRSTIAGYRVIVRLMMCRAVS